MNFKYMIIPSIGIAAIIAGARRINRISALNKFYNLYKGGQYCFGGSTPTTGFDCSGLTSFFYREYLNKEIPRRAINQAAASRITNSPAPADLVFFDVSGNGEIDHVGLYYGNDQFIHSGVNSGISIQNVNSNYWRPKLRGYGKI